VVVLPGSLNKLVRKSLIPRSLGDFGSWIIDCVAVGEDHLKSSTSSPSSYDKQHTMVLETRISPRSQPPQEFLLQGPTTSVHRNAPARLCPP
jgi:hypothetical protein